jgi:hypothetical protein
MVDLKRYAYRICAQHDYPVLAVAKKKRKRKRKRKKEKREKLLFYPAGSSIEPSVMTFTVRMRNGQRCDNQIYRTVDSGASVKEAAR